MKHNPHVCKDNSHTIAGVLLMAYLGFICTTHRQLVYLKNVDSSSVESFYPKHRPEYQIQTRDIMYVKIYSLNEEMSSLINQTIGSYQQNFFQNETSLFINGYAVSDSGNIEIPILGKIRVAGKTMDEAIYIHPAACRPVSERCHGYCKVDIFQNFGNW